LKRYQLNLQAFCHSRERIGPFHLTGSADNIAAGNNCLKELKMKHLRLLRVIALLVVLAVILTPITPGAAVSTVTGATSQSSHVATANSLTANMSLMPPIEPDQTDGPIQSRPSYTVTLRSWRNLRPTESKLNSVSMLTITDTKKVNCRDQDRQSKGWIVGDAGTILGYCNGVWDQAITTESFPTSLLGVQAISPTLGVAVGQDGAVLLYMYDKTANNWVWKKSPIPIGNQWLYNVSMVPNGNGGYDGWAVGTADPNAGGRGAIISGTIYAPYTTTATITPTHTYSWVRKTNDYAAMPVIDGLFAVHNLALDNAWAAGGSYAPASGVIAHWDGSQWTPVLTVNEGPFYGLRMRTPTDGWAVGQGGIAYHYNGSSWQKVNSPTTQILTSVSFDSNGTPWVSGYGNVILSGYFQNGQWQWNTYTDWRTDAFDYRAIDFTSGHGWLVGTHFSKSIGGQILEYDNNTWLAVTPPTDNRLNAVSTVDDFDAWAVGNTDAQGGTIIHWDGKHWQRWYQSELPIPAVNLNAIDMVSAMDGWAAGDPPAPGKPAIYLHWDGTRWAEPRYDAPVNVPVNDISMLSSDFGWSVANNGDAIAKYEKDELVTPPIDYWSALHACYGSYYQLRGTSVITTAYNNSWGSWDAWATGSRLPDYVQDPPPAQVYAVILRFLGGCSGGNAWQEVMTPMPCPPDEPVQGPPGTFFQDIKMRPGPWGYAVGSYHNRAVIHGTADGSAWNIKMCQSEVYGNPSQFNSVDILKGSSVAWFGGYYWDSSLARKVAFLSYMDSGGYNWAGIPFPVNGRNIWHRPVKSISMASDMSGWAVGDGYSSDPDKSVIFQYPYPNFTFNSTPAFQAVAPTQSTQFTITVDSLGAINSQVSINILDWPTGITGTVSPTSIDANSVATVYITTTNAPTGIHLLPIQGQAKFRSGDVEIPVTSVSSLKLTVTNDPVNSVTPSHGKAGTVVTISGSGFGADPGPGLRSTNINNVTWGGKRIPDGNVLSWAPAQITFTPPDAPGLFPLYEFPLVGKIIVTAGGSISNDDYTFKIDPYINTVSYTRDSSAFTVSLAGTSFGVDPGSLSRSTYFEHVSLNGTWVPNSNVKNWANNAITFTLPLTSTGGTVVVTTNGYESNAVTLSLGSNSSKVYLPTLIKY
jgi:photosystem II stability/assembly factor-like uncharacterized protein